MLEQTPVRVGGQDCHAKDHGAHTGDISAGMLKEAGVTRVDAFLTHDNYAEVLEPLLTPGTFVVNLSVDTSSVEILRLARERGAEREEA